jgi:ubiquinol oxidase
MEMKSSRRAVWAKKKSWNWEREKMAAPPIAKDYWRVLENAMTKDVLYAVRFDETTHRFVNHSLRNFDPNDVNPLTIRESDMHVEGGTIEYARLPDESPMQMSEKTDPGSLFSPEA